MFYDQISHWYIFIIMQLFFFLCCSTKKTNEREMRKRTKLKFQIEIESIADTLLSSKSIYQKVQGKKQTLEGVWFGLRF